MKVEVVKANPILPIGSVFTVSKQNKTSYTGIHGSMYGSYKVTIKKEFCRIYKKEGWRKLL